MLVRVGRVASPGLVGSASMDKGKEEKVRAKAVAALNLVFGQTLAEQIEVRMKGVGV